MRSTFILFSLALCFFGAKSVAQVNPNDSLTLIAIFEQFNEDAQNCLRWDFNDYGNPVSEWDGVVLADAGSREESVVGLELDDKMLSGDFPAEVSQLFNLYTLSVAGNTLTGLPENLPASLGYLNCSSNQLKSLPPMPSFLFYLDCSHNKLEKLPELNSFFPLRVLKIGHNRLRSIIPEGGVTIDSVYCTGNELTFEDLSEAINSELVINIVEYSDQKDFGVYEFFHYQGQNLSLDLYPDSNSLTSNVYSWEVNGLLMSNEKQFELQNLSVADSGPYFIQVTNPNYPDLVLEGEILLRVTESKDDIPFDTSTFIVRYPEDITPEEVDAQQAYLESEGWELLRECWCGGNKAPRLQLYYGEDKDIIDINTIHAKRKGKISNDTTEFNYFLIHDPEFEEEADHDCGTNINQPSDWTHRVKVALIDTGSDPQHQDLVNWFWQNPVPFMDNNCYPDDIIGWDFVNGTPDIIDKDKHGTIGMGIIKSRYPNDILLEVMNLKVFEEGKGLLFDLVCAVHYAVTTNADVLNISMGYYAIKPSSVFHQALQRAQEANIPAIVSSGNDSLNLDSLATKTNRWPGNFKQFTDSTLMPLDNIIVVAALNGSQDSLAPFSNYGQLVDLAAIGTKVRSTIPGNAYGVQSGTSISAAFVSRLVSIMKANAPDAHYSSIFECIKTTTDSTITGHDLLNWNGAMNASAALNCFGLTPPPGTSTERPATIAAYPNPVSDQLNIILEDGNTIFEDVTFSVLTLGGTVLYTESCSTNNIQWDGLDANGVEVPFGIYFIQVKVGNTQSFFFKIIKL